MSYFKSIGLTIQSPRLSPLVSAWSIVLYKLINAVAVMRILFPVGFFNECLIYINFKRWSCLQLTFVRNWLLPLITIHITVLSILLENTICSSLEIMRIVAEPKAVCFQFNVCVWSLIIVNIALLYKTILNLDEISKSLRPNNECCIILTDDEVFEYFPTDLYVQSKVPCINEIKQLIRSANEVDKEKQQQQQQNTY